MNRHMKWWNKNAGVGTSVAYSPIDGYTILAYTTGMAFMQDGVPVVFIDAACVPIALHSLKIRRLVPVERGE